MGITVKIPKGRSQTRLKVLGTLGVGRGQWDIQDHKWVPERFRVQILR